MPDTPRYIRSSGASKRNCTCFSLAIRTLQARLGRQRGTTLHGLRVSFCLPLSRDETRIAEWSTTGVNVDGFVVLVLTLGEEGSATDYFTNHSLTSSVSGLGVGQLRATKAGGRKRSRERVGRLVEAIAAQHRKSLERGGGLA